MRPSIELMAILDKHGEMTATNAARLLGVSRAQVGRLGHDLVRRGWADAITDPDDRRFLWFSITKEGKKALKNGGAYERRYHPVAGVDN